MKMPARRGNRRTAASLVEFAFVVPVLFLLLMGILEYGRYLFSLQLVNNAAREGARYAVVNINTASTSSVQDYVNQYLAGQGAVQYVTYSTATNITVYQADPATGANTGTSWLNAAWGDSIGVSVSGSYKPVLPGLLSMTGTVPLNGTCVMTTEAN